MDAWFQESSRRAHAMGSAAVRVCTNPHDGVVGFFALVNHEIRMAEDARVSRGDAGGLSTIPATLLARFALHNELRRQGLGVELLLEVLRVAVDASTKVASRLIVLDAKNEALAAWYQERSFKPINSNPLRLYMKMSTASQLIASVSARGAKIP